MIRVLHVLGTTNLGGAESRIMDLYRHMDRGQVQFDFLVHMDATKYKQAIADGHEPEEYREAGHFDDEIRTLGGRIYALPRFNAINTLDYKKAAYRFFAAHHDYTVIQGHMTSTASIYLPIAKEVSGGRCVTVAHTRNAGVDKGLKGILTNVLRASLPKKADLLFACSHLAGDATFGKHAYTYIPNTIDTSRFLFNESDRRRVRDEWGIPQDAIVLGNVARFTPQKNQRFLIDVLARMKENPGESAGENVNNIYAMFCGDGDLRKDCEEQAKMLGVSDQVIFAGNQKQVEKYYSAMDIYAFPSIYEGLPGVVVEAQASGLPCVISDTITTEVLITEESSNLPIEDAQGKTATDMWAEKLYGLIDSNIISAQGRAKCAAQVREAGFDVNDQARIMMEFYMNPDRLPSFER